jgi:hypothetical protein
MTRAIASVVVTAALACGGRMDGGVESEREAAATIEGEADATIDPGQSTALGNGSPSAAAASPVNPVATPIDETIVPEPSNTPANDCGYPTYPPTRGPAGDWVPYVAEDPLALLADVQSTMVGVWQGLVQTPWTTPYRVELSFTADGQYSSRCTEMPASCCVAFYYGTDNSTPLKQYRVDDVTLTGNVIGEIDVPFDYGDSYGLPGWQGELSHIERDASGNRLRFEFATNSGYGPLQFDVERVAYADGGGLPVR